MRAKFADRGSLSIKRWNFIRKRSESTSSERIPHSSCKFNPRERVFHCVRTGTDRLKGETSALENSGRLPASAYRGATMFTTLSPCDMCTGACILYGIARVVIGENKTFLGVLSLLAS